MAQGGVFLPLFVRCLLSTYYVLHAILDIQDTSVTKETKIPTFQELNPSEGRGSTDNKCRNKCTYNPC